MHKSKSPNENIIITSAGHNLVKSIYKYIELLNILNKFSVEIMVSLFKLFKFYIFSVFYLFGDVEL